MTESVAPRRPHAALNPAGRKPKAAKILRLLDIPADPRRVLRLLEVGTGSGVIAQYFAQLAAPRFEVEAVDVLDQRRVTDGYRFQLVGGTVLPFEDDSFDVVLSNHVIEHVGGRPDQARHLREIARVLRADGQGYLATPNRWQLVEPHFKLPFLSWLPRSLRDSYVRLAGRGPRYDCDPLARRELEGLLPQAGLAGANLLRPALQAMVALEPSVSRLARAFVRLPPSLLRLLQPIEPTHVYLLRRAGPPG
jgi:SAM-dependent methyltransferase